MSAGPPMDDEPNMKTTTGGSRQRGHSGGGGGGGSVPPPITTTQSAAAEDLADQADEGMGEDPSIIHGVGGAVYMRVNYLGFDYAVLKGKSIDDRDFVFAIKVDKSSGDAYYIHVPTKQKTWYLPAADRAATGGAGGDSEAVLNNPWRGRFIRFYERYNPERLPFVDPTLLQYPGREEVLMKALVKKYGPEPPDPNGPPPTTSPTIAPAESHAGAGNEDHAQQQQQQQEATATATAAAALTPAAAVPSTTDQFRARVTSIIGFYKPNKLNLVDKYMEKYSGHEDELIQFLLNKFGPEPPSSPAAAVPAATAPNDLSAGGARPTDHSNAADYDHHHQEESSVPMAAPAVDTMLSGSGGDGHKGTAQRETALMGFLKDREARLEAALCRNADLTSEIGTLREHNQRLLGEARELKTAVELATVRVSGDVSRLQSEAGLLTSGWEEERRALQARILEAEVNHQRLLNDERVRFEQASSQHHRDKGSLVEELQRSREHLAFCQRKTSDLLAAVDRREVSTLQLRKEFEELQRTQQLMARREDRSTQTASQQSSSSGGGGSGGAMVVWAGGSDGDAPPNPTVEAELERLRRHAAAMEQTIHRLRGECDALMAQRRVAEAKTSALSSIISTPRCGPTTTASDYAVGGPRTPRSGNNSFRGGGPAATAADGGGVSFSPMRTAADGSVSIGGAVACSTQQQRVHYQQRLSQAHATIASLRAANQALEERVEVLEMQALALPPSAPQQSGGGDAGSSSMSPPSSPVAAVSSADVQRLHERLAAAEAAARAYKREITDLRGLLARYMTVQGRHPSQPSQSLDPHRSSTLSANATSSRGLSAAARSGDRSGVVRAASSSASTRRPVAGAGAGLSSVGLARPSTSNMMPSPIAAAR